MRMKNTIKNARINFIFTTLLIPIVFINRSIMIKFLGSTYTGLDAVIQNYIMMLSVPTIFASAIGYCLYKPLADDNFEKINSMISFFKKIYKYSSWVILGIGVGVSITLPIVAKGVQDKYILFLSFYILLVATFFTYRLTYLQILLTADQKGYVVNKCINIAKFIKLVFQGCITIYYSNYIIWVIIDVICNIIGYYIVLKKAKKEYSWLMIDNKSSLKTLFHNNREVVITSKNILFHRFGTLILYQTDSMIISIFLNLNYVTMYTNYMMIFNQVLNVITQLINSATASVGNLIAKESYNKRFEVWRQLNSIEHCIGGICTIILFFVISPFIELWAGKEFVLDKIILILFCVNFYLTVTRLSILMFKSASGIYWDIWAPIIEGIINLGISIILVKYMGVAGVLIGTLISYLCVTIGWGAIITFKKCFNLNFIYFIKYFLQGGFLTLISFFICRFIISSFSLQNTNFFVFLFNSIKVGIVVTIVTLCLFLLKKDFRKVLEKFLITVTRKNIL